MKTNFIPYTNVSMARLHEIAFNISQLSQYDLREAIVEFLRRGFGFKFSKQRMFNFDIVPTSINGVENVAIIVKYPKNPILYSKESKTEHGAIAHLIKMNGDKTESNVIPVILLFNADRSMSVLNHEKIHIHQLLLESHYPFSEEEFALFIAEGDMFEPYDYFRKSLGDNEALRYAINFVGFRFWAEAEAIFHDGEKDLNSWLKTVFICFDPFDYLRDFDNRFGWNEGSWNTALYGFSQFCFEMQTEVDWMREMLGGKLLIEELYNVSEAMRLQKTFDREKMNLFHNNRGSHEKYMVKADSKKTGRNEPCHCGSGKKHKKCCLNKDA